MKKIIAALILFNYLFIFSQPIIVNPTTYTIDQLVNQVLINSPCVSGFNVTSKNGNQFGSTNSIGYFENQNSNFPITRGVVLSTGNVARVPSPNSTILSDGNALWTGDLDMEANLLSQSGISIQSVNASYLEFDFIPKTPLFNFSFVFASEEYGASQCNYSDSFAFLLKDMTTGSPYINLAVIPSTTIPILVTTIRDVQYNPNCPSENPAYFGSFNGSGFGPAINFNGETVQLSASASGLDISHTYHIKIVIADGDNNIGYDSAIFLAANSFNIGQNVLGLDYTVANNNALCPNTILPTLNASGLSPLTTFTWLNGTTPILGQTGSTLNLETLVSRPTAGISSFSVIYTEPNCIAITDEIVVQIYPDINVMTTLPTIYSCAGSTPNSFDLEINTPIIIGGSTLPINTIITYFATNNDAIANISALSSPYFTSTNQTIFARINSTTYPCFAIKSFLLNIVPNPTIFSIPPTLSVCATTATLISPKANFNLTASKNLIFGSQSQIYNKISYHSTQVGADTNTALLVPNMSSVLLSISRTLYVRIQNISNPNCYITTSFDLFVKPKPSVDAVPNTVVCTSFVLPMLVSVGAQYSTLSGGLGSHPAAGDIITPSSPSNFIDMFVSNSLSGCTNQRLFKITKIDIAAITPPSSSHCNSYVLPNLPYGKYYTMANGAGSILPNGTIIRATTTLYVRYDGACIYEDSFEITIYPLSPLPNYPPIFSCNDYILPVDTNGGTYYSGPNKLLPIIAPGTSINSTTTIWVYKENTNLPFCTSEKSFVVNIGPSSLSPPIDIANCSTYVLPDPLISGAGYWSSPNGSGISYPVGSSIDATTTLYYHVSGQSCTDNLPFTITIKLAALPNFSDTAPVCDVFYLPVVTTHAGNYYTGTEGTGILRLPGFPVTSSQTMYFYDSAIPNTCFVEKSFMITVNQSPLITVKPNEVYICNDNYILDDLNDGEYYQFIGGPTTSNPVLPPNFTFPLSTGTTTIYVYNSNGFPAPDTCISEYSISIKLINTLVNPIADQFICDSFNLPAINLSEGNYYTETNGPNGIGTIVTTPYAPITSTTTLYLYKESVDRISCSNEDAFTINVQTSPTVSAINPIEACDSYVLPSYNSIITNGGIVSHYFTIPGGFTVSGNTEKFPTDVITSSITLYAYLEVGTAATAICSDEKPFQITINSTPTLVPSEIVSSSHCDIENFILSPLSVGNYFEDLAHSIPLVNSTIVATKTIYVYAETNTNLNCDITGSFVVTIYDTPVFALADTAPVFACNSYTLPVLTTPNSKYFTAANGGGTEILSGTIFTAPTHTIYVHAENGVIPVICPADSSLQINIFNVSEPLPNTNPNTFCGSYLLPTINKGNYYTLSNGLGTPMFAGQTITTSQTIYVYGVSPLNPSCSDEYSFAVNIVSPFISPITPKVACDSYILPSYNSIATNGGIVSHYYTLPGGSSVSGNTEKFPTDVITSSITLYAYLVVGTAATAICSDEKPFQITINSTPTLVPSEIVSSSHCATENFTLSPLTFGNYFEDLAHTIPLISSSIVATKTIYVYAENNTMSSCIASANFTVTIYDTPVFAPAEIATVFTCNSYTLPVLTTPNSKYFTAANGGGTEILSGTIFTALSQTIYVHAVNGISPVICPADSSLQINIFNVSEPLPNTTPNTFCGSYQLPILAFGNYYNAPNGLGTPMFASQFVTTSQTIYVYAISPSNPLCFDEYSFYLEIIYAPTVFPIPVTALNKCDLDGINDGVTLFDLTTLTPFLLGTQIGPQFTVQYYANYGNAILNSTPITNTLSTFIYYSINDSSSANSCSAVNTMPIQININKLPEPKPFGGAVCIDENGNVVKNYTLFSRLSNSNYSFEWTNSLGVIAGTNSNLTVSTPDNYTVLATSTLTGCVSETVTATVINSQKAVVSYTVSNAFDNNQIITVIATGAGNNYEYQIDGGQFQNSPIFQNQNYVLEHTIIVRDKNGCGSTPLTAVVVNYPKLFTPNGDSYSDTWMVSGISQLKNVKLYIYNRYGKLLTQLNSKNESWDGTINNTPLPADDYWFTISYTENGNSKEFKSHFSLKR